MTHTSRFDDDDFGPAVPDPQPAPMPPLPDYLDPLCAPEHDAAAASDAMDIVRVSAVAVTAGFTDVGTATDGLTSLMSYGKTAGDAADVSDRMFKAVQIGKLEHSDLASNIAMVAPAASAASMSMDSLLASISTITATGASTSEAVTLMLNLFKSFSKPTDEAARAAHAAGIELGGAALSGDRLADTMAQFQGMDLEQIFAFIPDQQTARAVAALSGQLTRCGQWSAPSRERGHSGQVVMPAASQTKAR